MYVPPHFAETDVASLHARMRAHSFATLVSWLDGAPFATHVPLLLDAERGPLGTLVGHVARANPHARAFDGAAPSLAIFAGPHAYVSPRWYATSPNVPTWNYVAVHATGRVRAVEDAARVRALLARSAALYEAGADAPWSPDAAPAYVEKLLRGIAAFELPIERLEGKRKLSQNKKPSDRAGVVAALRAQGDEASAAIAAEMEALA
ncbi:MAG: FMN-binding negative transcriptional regulator [Proteobacteria bacterium]|nr:MAG: FMN-binding negative transcriptional regulator [Pseudomonadota bacterium]